MLLRLLPPVIALVTLVSPAAVTAADVGVQTTRAGQSADTLPVQSVRTPHPTVPAVIGGIAGSGVGAVVGLHFGIQVAISSELSSFPFLLATTFGGSALGAGLGASAGVALGGGHPDVRKSLKGGLVGLAVGLVAASLVGPDEEKQYWSFAITQGVVTGLFTSR